MTKDTNEQLQEFYNSEIPAYISNAGKSFITIKTTTVLDEQINLKITIKDVITYYRVWARNISSGIRKIAGHTGDWRHIDNLAKECLEWFKLVNIDTLAKEGEKYGMELKV